MNKAKKIFLAGLLLAATGMGFVWSGHNRPLTNLNISGHIGKSGAVTFIFPPPSGDGGDATPTPTPPIDPGP